MADTGPLHHLIHLLAKLPGLGPRSARRAVIHLLQHRAPLMEPLSQALENALTHIQECQTCGNMDTTPVCHVCSDPRRDASVLCIIESVADLWALERNSFFKGHFHVLGGTLSALDGVGPEDLRIKPLMQRLERSPVQEIILALNATINGQTTAHFLADQLSPFGVKITALAHGVPVGGELDYLDDGTITTALQARHAFA